MADETNEIIADQQTPQEKFEQARLSRRAALRKIGITSGMALFGMFAVDDLARLAIKKMEENKETREIGETVAREFKNTGVVFATTGGPSDYTHSSPSDPCEVCSTVYQNQSDASAATYQSCSSGTTDPIVQQQCTTDFENRNSAYATQYSGCLDVNNC